VESTLLVLKSHRLSNLVPPRYDVSMFQMEKWITNLLPSRQFGFLLFVVWIENDSRAIPAKRYFS